MRRIFSPLLAIIGVVLIAPYAAAQPGDGVASAGRSGPVQQRIPPEGILGIDVSHWNDRIRWNKVANDDIGFAIAKATEGKHFEDPRYARNRAQARDAGIAFTAYEFADPDKAPRDPVRDARHFMNVADLKPTDLIPVLDLEQTGGLSRDQLLTWTQKWCDEVERRLDVRPMVYTSPSFWTDHMKDSTLLAEAGTRLWVAHWFVDTPTVPAGNWNELGWRVWQWSDRGRVRGIDGRVDMNVLADAAIDDLLIKNSGVASL